MEQIRQTYAVVCNEKDWDQIDWSDDGSELVFVLRIGYGRIKTTTLDYLTNKLKELCIDVEYITRYSNPPVYDFRLDGERYVIPIVDSKDSKEFGVLMDKVNTKLNQVRIESSDAARL